MVVKALLTIGIIKNNALCTIAGYRYGVGYLQALEGRVKSPVILCGGECGTHPLKLGISLGLF